jgi:hypothetical protein
MNVKLLKTSFFILTFSIIEPCIEIWALLKKTLIHLWVSKMSKNTWFYHFQFSLIYIFSYMCSQPQKKRGGSGGSEDDLAKFGHKI